MMLLVSLTGTSGFVGSYLFLHAGLIEMWLRYLASFAVSYLVFLVLLWLWLRTRAEDYADLSVDSGPSSSGSGCSGSCYSGRGGISAAGALVVRLMRKLRISWHSASREARSAMLSARLRRLRSSLFRCSSWLSLALWFSRPSSCSITWSIRLRRSLQNSWWTVCCLQASIANSGGLKRATGLKLPSVIRRCHSLWPQQSFPLPVGRCLSMRRRPIQLAM